MPQLPLSSVTTPFYGGGQVPNPANVIIIKGTGGPPTVGIGNALGTIAINATPTVWIADGHVGGATQWAEIATGTGSILTINSNAPLAGNYILAGTAAQIAVAQTAGTTTFRLVGPYTPATYTAHGVLIGEGATSIVATAVGATGTVLAGTTGADPAFTGSPSVSGSLTAATTITSTLGNITATNGNFVATASGTGIVLTPVSGSGTTTATANGRSGVVTITTPSIAGGAVFTMTITNSSITGSGTDVLYNLVGGTTGAGLSIQSVSNSASTSAVVINNATGATTNTASLLLYFVVLN